MAVLNTFQKITRVLPGQPFGNGSDGALSSATIPTVTTRSCSGTATASTLTIGSSGFTNGDVILIWQVRGTGVGQWEINRITSGGGTTTLTLQVALNYTYTDSGASQAQVVKILQYSTAVVETGTWTLTDWAGDTGGILAFAAKNSATVTGTITGTGKGYVGGAVVSIDAIGRQGEGTTAAGGTQSIAANGSGAGGGASGSGLGGGEGGSGGGHVASGTSGTNGSPGGSGSAGGGTSGAADLTTITFGGSGGSGGGDDNNVGNTGAGGDGGGLIAIFANTITVTGAINDNGGNGTNGAVSGAGGGGAGAGGSILLVVGTATLGTSLITAATGTAGTATGQGGGGGASSAGRIAVHHSGTVTGTTNPTFTDVTDGTLIATDGAFLFSLL